MTMKRAAQGQGVMSSEDFMAQLKLVWIILEGYKTHTNGTIIKCSTVNGLTHFETSGDGTAE